MVQLEDLSYAHTHTHAHNLSRESLNSMLSTIEHIELFTSHHHLNSFQSPIPLKTMLGFNVNFPYFSDTNFIHTKLKVPFMMKVQIWA